MVIGVTDLFSIDDLSRQMTEKPSHYCHGDDSASSRDESTVNKISIGLLGGINDAVRVGSFGVSHLTLTLSSIRTKGSLWCLQDDCNDTGASYCTIIILREGWRTSTRSRRGRRRCLSHKRRFGAPMRQCTGRPVEVLKGKVVLDI